MKGSPFARPMGEISAANAAFQAGLSGMAQIAALRPPGDSVIVAHAAEFAVDDFRHEHIVSAGAHFETEFRMADLAAEADAMKPVREDHRPHAFLLRTLVEHHVPVFGPKGKGSKQHEPDHCTPQQAAAKGGC